MREMALRPPQLLVACIVVFMGPYQGFVENPARTDDPKMAQRIAPFAPAKAAAS